MNERLIAQAMKATSPHTILNDGAVGKGGGSLKLFVRRGVRGTSATWFATWKRDGKASKRKIGRYPAMTLKDARARFDDEIQPAILSGANPRNTVEAEGEPTVARLFAAYVAGMRSAGKASADEVERALLTGKYAAASIIGADRLAGDVVAGDVAMVLGGAYTRGARVTADRVRAYMSAAFGWGIRATNDYTSRERRDWGVRTNPVGEVKRDTGAAKTRDRTLSREEFAALWHDASGMGVVGSAIRILLCCGQRVRETLRLDAGEVDLTESLWKMPAEKTKGKKRSHIIPLHELAAEVLTERIRISGTNTNAPLFPASVGTVSASIPRNRLDDGAINRALRSWTESRGFERMQARDLRRTWKSRTADANIDRFVRDLIQQHAKGDTGSKSYDRADYLPQMRTAMSTWCEWIRETLAHFPHVPV